jgi:DNA mismatch repair protein MutS2
VLRVTGSEQAAEREGVLATDAASTPSPFSVVASHEVLGQLEFFGALEVVAQYAMSALGADSVRARVPGTSLEVIQHALSTVAQFQELLDAGDPFRPENVPDVTPVVEQLRVAGSVLEPEQLNSVRIAIEGMHRVKSGLDRIGDEAPLVASLTEQVPPPGVAGRIAKALDPDGAVKDDASPELARARRRVRDTRAKLVAFLEKQLRAYGQDAGGGAVTMKGGRYVIPVRRDDRNRVQGIVHGESSSGATLFVEPPEAVQLGNELSGWESEEARAVLAVLRGLTDEVRSHREALDSGLSMCRRVDDAYARARYAVETDGHAPTVVEAPANLVVARGVHPLLRVEAEQPVPFDLDLSGTEHTLLVSGPNAGGKTVMLKAVGLLSALAQSGVIPPVGPGTTLPVFGRLFVDIGDHQSIAASLSTFSAHVAALKHILIEADAASLVLLDEIGGGTDPTEGAALAGATLLSLNARGSTTVATTHLGELKDLASETDGIVNGSLQFDLDALTPTYRFIKNQPGRSYGIAIARRLGLPPDVLERAERLQPEQARSLDAVLAEVERKEEELSRRADEISFEAARVTKLRGESESLKQQLDERQRSVEEREREMEREGRKQAREFLLQARRRVEEALELARAAATDAAAKEARRLVEQGVREEGDALARLAEAGWRVSGNGERGSGSRGTGEREAGSGEGETGNGNRETGSDAATVLPSYRPTALPPYRPTAPPSSEIDLRGLTADEAEDVLVRAIDDAVADGLPWLRIIHGKGTGALRKRVSQVLKRDGRVASYQLAPPAQGGTGVTLVEFK